MAAVRRTAAVTARGAAEHLRRRALRLQASQRAHRDRLGGELLDAADHADIAALGQRDRAARAAGAAGAADAVHIVLGLHRQAEVDDMADGRHVDAARGDVGGHQDAQLAAAQCHQRAVATALRHAAVQRRDRMAHLVQMGGQLVGVALGAGEDHRLLHLGAGQQVLEQCRLVVQVIGPQQLLLDVGVAVGVVGDLDALGIVLQDLVGQATDLTGEGRADHHGLAAGRQGFGDALDVLDEAHVQHAVGFVQDQHLDLAQDGLAAVEVVDQAARGGDQQIDRTAQRGQLGAVGHAADDGGDLQVRDVAAVGDRGLGDLDGQLAGRGQHQHARTLRRLTAQRAAARGRIGLAGGQHTLECRQHEGGGLAAAGVGAHAQIRTGHRGGNGLRLHVGRVLVAGSGDGLQDGLVQAQGRKAHVNTLIRRHSGAIRQGFPARRGRGGNTGWQAGEGKGASSAWRLASRSVQGIGIKPAGVE